MSAMGQKLTVQCKEACPLYPQKRHQMRHMECPLWANSGHSAIYSIPSSICGTRGPRRWRWRNVSNGLKERRANRRACSELKHDGYRLRTPHSPQDDNLSTHAHACIQVHNVLVVHANTSVRDEPADRSRIVRAVDGVLTAAAKCQRCCTHRIRRAAARNDRRQP